MTTELATIDGEIIEDSPQPVTLFGTTDPAAIVERASTLATALADVISRKHLFKNISGRNHVLVEGWTLLGSMLGVFAEVEWTRPTENGWEARAVARTLNGKIVGAAEAMCSRSERTWNNRDEYALRSMAQTRAVSKALRLPLGYIIELAGYSATPADEIPDDHQPQQVARPAQAPARTADPRNRGEAQQAIANAAHARGWNIAKVDELAKSMGIKRGESTLEQLIALLRAIEQPEVGLPTPPATPQESTPSGDQGSTTGSTPPAATSVQPEPEVAPPASEPAVPSDAELLAAAGPGAELVPDKPDYVKRAEARAASAKASPKGARETHEAEEVTAGL